MARKFRPTIGISVLTLGLAGCVDVSGPGDPGLMPRFDAHGDGCIEPPSGIASWWPLDETSGTMAEDVTAGGSNSGTHIGGPTPLLGKVDGALGFDGVDDRVHIPDPLSTLQQQTFTIEAWVKTSTAELQCIVCKPFGNNNQNSFALFITPGLILGSYIGTSEAPGDGALASGGPALTLGQFHHVAMTWDGRVLLLYLDGLLAFSDARAAGRTIVYDDSPVHLATDADPTDDFVAFLGGVIDEVRFFDSALSADKIKAISDAGSATRCRPAYEEELDTTPPALSFALDVTEIWPPNHSMVTVATGISATDDQDPSPTIEIEVESNEPADGTGDGDISPDWAVINNGDGTFDVQVRAERSGKGDGRVYTITVTATDDSENEASVSHTVAVPHDKRNGRGRGRGR